MSKELKPCPFCGTIPELNFHQGNWGYSDPSVSINCCHGIVIGEYTKKHMGNDVGYVDCKEEAISAVVDKWNTRASIEDK